jgi:hypothetical protein
LVARHVDEFIAPFFFFGTEKYRYPAMGVLFLA